MKVGEMGIQVWSIKQKTKLFCVLHMHTKSSAALFKKEKKKKKKATKKACAEIAQPTVAFSYHGK